MLIIKQQQQQMLYHGRTWSETILESLAEWVTPILQDL